MAISDKTNDRKSLNYTQIITVLISALTLSFGVFSYFSTQKDIDRRKYNNAFYDERYRVLKEVTKSISEITNIITWSEEYNEPVVKEIYSKTGVFGYSHLVLNEHTLQDSIVLELIYKYELILAGKVMGWGGTQYTADSLAQIGKTTIQECGKILIYEKDNTNSFTSKF